MSSWRCSPSRLSFFHLDLSRSDEPRSMDDVAHIILGDGGGFNSFSTLNFCPGVAHISAKQSSARTTQDFIGLQEERRVNLWAFLALKPPCLRIMFRDLCILFDPIYRAKPAWIANFFTAMLGATAAALISLTVCTWCMPVHERTRRTDEDKVQSPPPPSPPLYSFPPQR